MVTMKLFCLLICLTVSLNKASTQDSGRNDGEPDYDPEGLLINLRDGGRNDGEPDYDPEELLVNLRDGGRNDGKPDYDPDGVFMDLRDGGRNEGEPDYEALDDKDPRDTHPYLMLMPEDFKEMRQVGDDFSYQGDGGDIAIDIPDSVWAHEKNATRNRGESRIEGRQSNPPSSACLNIMVVYNQGWVQSSASGNAALGLQRAKEVVAEAERIYNDRYSSANRLGTSITWNVVGGDPVLGTGSWQATSGSLQSSAVQNWVGNSLDIHHYAFLAGRDFSGAIGIAYVGTPCFRLSGDQRLKVSINEWYNNVAESAGVLAHEVGHALGMYHDFGNGGTSDIRYDSNGNRCTGLNGLMDYGARSSVDKFTTCSREDFVTWYQRVMNTFGEFCLDCGRATPTAPPAPTTPTPGQCDGVPSTDWSCCSTSSPCSVGGGDCDFDSHCASGLTCGNNNCRNDFSSSGSNWASSADCCEAPSTAPTTTPGPTVAPNCDGIPSTDWSCCTSSNVCTAGQGDCDVDSQCASGLVCGTNNCQSTGVTGSNWASSADCCEVQPTSAPGLCDGIPATDWSCCSSSNPCTVGEGDCDTDSHCAGTLQCGVNNCDRDFATSGSNWASSADCCEAAPPTTTPGPTVAPNCDGIPSTDWSCCTSSNQCTAGQGDCDVDSQCASGLVCGSNNCQSTGVTGSNWASGADCCEVAPPTTTPGPTVAPNCDGVPSTDWSCCSSSNQCSAGQGDCDSDSHCASGLVCGNNNCQSTGVTGSNWSSSADCCEAPPTPGPTVAPPTDCGIAPSRIVGGSAVTPYSLPWQVGLVRSGRTQPFCGGILITERHVLTAAHCTSGSIDVMVGEHRITSSADGTRHTTCRYRDHPNYGNLNNDFAILHLNNPVTLGARAVPACLPDSTMAGDFLGGKTLTVSGWGALSEGGGSPTVLHSVDVPGMTNSQCNSNYPGQITSSMVCAGQAGGGIDSCQGDSGGPLTYTAGGKTYVVGVVSWGSGCARPNKAGVYARVTSAMSFIQEELGKTC